MVFLNPKHNENILPLYKKTKINLPQHINIEMKEKWEGELKGEGSWANGEGREKGWGAGKRENDNMENLLWLVIPITNLAVTIAMP